MNIKQITAVRTWCVGALLIVLLGACGPAQIKSPLISNDRIDRQSWVTRHHPQMRQLDPKNPFTIGNGQFAFTADVTGLQSFYDLYFDRGIPLETKAKWAWHSRANPQQYQLSDANKTYSAYGRQVDFPTNMDSPAGQWLRQNPHDLPLFKAAFYYADQPLEPGQLTAVKQELNLWQGHLESQFHLNTAPVSVESVVDSASDTFSAVVQSALLQNELSVRLQFPRGYDMRVKNTPRIDWSSDDGHQTTIVASYDQGALIQRSVDGSRHFVSLRWRTPAVLKQLSEHEFELRAEQVQKLEFSVSVSPDHPGSAADMSHANIIARTSQSWFEFWNSGAALDFSSSTHPKAAELERRIVLSRYLMAVQARANMPAQETGLTTSSWYGKHHSEMTYWHVAHWILWGNTEYAEAILDWYVQKLPSAKSVAAARGLKGARWAKMVGPDNRESPGGNPLIIWNQPQLIQLAEMLYQRLQDERVLYKYIELVEESAWAMSSMLTYDAARGRYNLDSPIWIAQEIYDPKQTRNPTFELAYWRYGLQTALAWHQRLGLKPHTTWQDQLERLAALPIKDQKYVAIESIADTWDNAASRRDHPSMLGAYGVLNDDTVDPFVMTNTLAAVIDSWDWQEKIWGWDYPMIAMTAARLDQPEQAVSMLLADLHHNHYLINGHVPQPGANLTVYLPANGALLTAVAMMVGGWSDADGNEFSGFPNNGQWRIKAEGFTPYR